MKDLRFLQTNKIDVETLNDPVKCKAYFDWKYENFEEEYKIYREEKRKLLNEFLNTLPLEKKEYYMKRREEYGGEFLEISKRYEPVINKALENEMEFLTLEVRESNCKAISLYTSLGFETVGKRPRFYREPDENAILMTKYKDRI
jgi:ribosomal-protein-alanine N-acetyltransferase